MPLRPPTMPCQPWSITTQGMSWELTQRRIIWKRGVDLNDRRHVTVGLGSRWWYSTRMVLISVASEIMAILCLATDVKTWKSACKHVGSSLRSRTPVYCPWSEKSEGYGFGLERYVKPNLVQTIYGTPALFMVDRLLSPTAVTLFWRLTHAVLGRLYSDGGGIWCGPRVLKFLDTKTPNLPNLSWCGRNCCDLRALKMNSGVAKEALRARKENVKPFCGVC